MPSTAPQFNGKVSNSLIHQQVRVRRVNETVARCAGLLQCNTRRQGSSTDSRCAGTGLAPSAGWNHPDPETPLLPRPLPKAALLALLLALPGPRPEERGGGREYVRTGRLRGSPYHDKKNKTQNILSLSLIRIDS